MTFVLGVLLFAPAGTLRWPGAWVFLGIMLASSLALGAMLLREDPDLLEERLRPPVQSEQDRTDKMVTSIMLALFVAWLPVMAIDTHRLEWSHVPAALSVLGAIGVAACFVIVGRVFRANAFLIPVVKSQANRGQRVISTGPYAHVRHPMYAGVLPFLAGTPPLLGSWLGLGWAALILAAIGVRAVFEERMLARTLDGYESYLKRVRYRLIPGVW